ncbi:MAG: ArsA family ATPase [Deltaproteobacteria bacterium]|nr:ArsA family ATPase [Deltaproteobacteria bacterium]
MTASGLADLLLERRVIVCVGSGGVGKTTLAASLGIEAARLGRRVLVLTIDPARRLADALGLPSFGNEVRRVDVRGALPEGHLDAMMLDTRATFDDLIRRLAPDEVRRREILENQVYRLVSDSFGSSQEYMATEKLYDVVATGRYDLVVLDTPPVKNALEFLDAPGRLARFLDRRIVKWFLTPYDENRVFGRVLIGTSGVVFRLLGVIFGREFLGELSRFFIAFRDMYDGFRERHEAVTRIFEDQATAFLVVSAPTEASVDVATFFREELLARRLVLGGFLVNQVHGWGPEVEDPADILEPLLTNLPEDRARRVRSRCAVAYGRTKAVAAREGPLRERIRRYAHPDRVYAEIPLLPEPVRDLEGLDAVIRHLFPAHPDP